ncbi:hypothetical protein BDV93DRAFT_304457 [Ceratobasidium sp. AG-I]|nr:hypothetical protein BDV93DRAFT_304457 [Ceratobasidium sp. AG-I]
MEVTIFQKMQLAREAALSFTHNPDNSESPWYIFWGLVLGYLTDGISPNGYCLPAPQYILRILLQRDIFPNRVAAGPLPVPLDPESDSDSGDEEVALDPDGSMMTTASLTGSYHKKSPKRSPDFVAVYFHVTAPIQAPLLYDMEFLKRRWSSRVPLIMEIKRSPPRLTGFRDRKFMKKARDKLSEIFRLHSYSITFALKVRGSLFA